MIDHCVCVKNREGKILEEKERERRKEIERDLSMANCQRCISFLECTKKKETKILPFGFGLGFFFVKLTAKCKR